MKKICKKNLQRQITNLIPIIEIYTALIGEIEQTKNQLHILPGELDRLKKQADYLKTKTTQQSEKNLQSEFQNIEYNLDSLVDDLERISLDLANFDVKLKNAIVLKEKLEAIQEERIDGLTPERIYKLLEKQKRSLQEDFILPAESYNTSLLTKSPIPLKQKKSNFGDGFSKQKMTVAITIIASLFLGWFAGYHSSTNVRLENNEAIEKSQELNNSSVDIES